MPKTGHPLIPVTIYLFYKNNNKIKMNKDKTFLFSLYGKLKDFLQNNIKHAYQIKQIVGKCAHANTCKFEI